MIRTLVPMAVIVVVDARGRLVAIAVIVVVERAAVLVVVVKAVLPMLVAVGVAIVVVDTVVDDASRQRQHSHERRQWCQPGSQSANTCDHLRLLRRSTHLIYALTRRTRARTQGSAHDDCDDSVSSVVARGSPRCAGTRRI